MGFLLVENRTRKCRGYNYSVGLPPHRKNNQNIHTPDRHFHKLMPYDSDSNCQLSSTLLLDRYSKQLGKVDYTRKESSKANRFLV
jgi:hypothetical protein